MLVAISWLSSARHRRVGHPCKIVACRFPQTCRYRSTLGAISEVASDQRHDVKTSDWRIRCDDLREEWGVVREGIRKESLVSVDIDFDKQSGKFASVSELYWPIRILLLHTLSNNTCHGSSSDPSSLLAFSLADPTCVELSPRIPEI